MGSGLRLKQRSAPPILVFCEKNNGHFSPISIGSSSSNIDQPISKFMFALYTQERREHTFIEEQKLPIKLEKPTQFVAVFIYFLSSKTFNKATICIRT